MDTKTSEIEDMFSELYYDHERFENLQYALAMFGAGTSIEADEKMLIRKFKHAKNIIFYQTHKSLKRINNS